MSSDILFLQERLAEAARYALMRRLMPAIRHNISGTLQPVSMVAAILERRMKSATPDMAQLVKNSQSLIALSREAAANSMNLMTWLAPKDNDAVAVSSAVQEALELMTTELCFRGFVIANETADLNLRLPRGIVRSVFTACLIALTDMNEGVAKVVISADESDSCTRLKIRLEAGGSPGLVELGGRLPSYRRLDWSDVQVLAEAEGVSVSHDADGAELLYASSVDPG